MTPDLKETLAARPFQRGEAVVYAGNKVTQVLRCEWEPGWRQWNVALENKEQGGVFYLPATHIQSLRNYLKEHSLINQN